MTVFRVSITKGPFQRILDGEAARVICDVAEELVEVGDLKVLVQVDELEVDEPVCAYRAGSRGGLV